jgi:hypothetical protein
MKATVTDSFAKDDSAVLLESKDKELGGRR